MVEKYFKKITRVFKGVSCVQECVNNVSMWFKIVSRMNQKLRTGSTFLGAKAPLGLVSVS